MQKDNFHMPFWEFQIEVIPFSLMNASSTFQRMMDYAFRDLPFECVYFYDVVVLPDSMTSHVEHLHQVFQVIAKGGLKFKI